MHALSHSRPTPETKPHDLAVMIRLDRVNAPKQARTEKRLQEIVQALESLLDGRYGRSFDEITIPDIAERADCGAASIYARFRDKRSILVALHESIRDRQIAHIDEATSFERHEGLSLEESILFICRYMVAYYSRNRNMLRPAYLLGDSEIYQRAAAAIRYSSERIALLLLPKLGDPPATDLDKRLDLAVKAAFALVQQRMVFEPIPIGRYVPASDDELAAELALLLKSSLSHVPAKACPQA
jgi:AcrR family transcriptional regulator